MVGGLIEHEVDRPHMTGMGSAQPLLLTWTYPSALACPHGVKAGVHSTWLTSWGPRQWRTRIPLDVLVHLL